MALTYCPLFSGSSGNAAVLATDSTCILIDAGLTGKSIVDALKHVDIEPTSLQGILITHEHSDHTKAAGILSRRFDVPIYANAATWTAMEPKIGQVAPKNIRLFTTNQDFIIDDLTIMPYAIPHDAVDPVGFCFFNRGLKIAQMTDLGHVPNAVLEHVNGADLLLLESNHDVQMLKNGMYPQYLKQRILGKHGHLSNDTAGEVCIKLALRGIRRFILGHLSGENNREPLAYSTVANALQAAGAEIDGDVELYMAHRDHAAEVFYLE